MAITDARYVSFTTYRHTGEAVATPVWIAALPDGRAAFTTAPAAGKVRRLAHTPKVSLSPSDARGKVADGVTPTGGTATVVTDGPDHAAAVAALGRKYGIQFAVVRLGGKVRSLFGRDEAAVVLITLDP
ncbi:MAG: hypothetical protein JWM47_3287 [Acidimicrobiales bacterium]|nr:hypothetical protein [Acidimicrobiales bacterium]